MLPTINNKKERGIDRIAIGSLAIDAYNISKTSPSSLIQIPFEQLIDPLSFGNDNKI